MRRAAGGVDSFESKSRLAKTSVLGIGKAVQKTGDAVRRVFGRGRGGDGAVAPDQGDTVRGNRAAAESAKKAAESTSRYNTKLFKLGKAAGIAGAAIAAFGFALFKLGQSMFRRSREALQFAESIAKIQRQTTFSAISVQRWRATLQQAGLDADELTDTSQELSEKLNDLRIRDEKAVKAFRALGLEFADLAQKSPDEQLRRVLLALNEIEGQARKIAIARQLFGDDEAKKAIALAGQIAAAGGKLAELPKAALLTEEQLKTSRDILAAFREIQTVIQGIFAKAVIQNADTMLDLAKSLRDAVLELAKSGAIEQLTTSLAELLANKTVIGGLKEFVRLLGKMAELANQAAESFDRLTDMALDAVPNEALGAAGNRAQGIGVGDISTALINPFAQRRILNSLLFGGGGGDNGQQAKRMERLQQRQLEAQREMLNEFRGGQ